jgi:hypothetical protein
LLTALGKLGPKELIAITLKVYVVPEVNPATVTGDDEPEPLYTPQLVYAV